jgi:hypothetical protein
MNETTEFFVRKNDLGDRFYMRTHDIDGLREWTLDGAEWVEMTQPSITKWQLDIDHDLYLIPESEVPV